MENEEDQQTDSREHCTVCGESAEGFVKTDEGTYRFNPCGHEVDSTDLLRGMGEDWERRTNDLLRQGLDTFRKAGITLPEGE